MNFNFEFWDWMLLLSVVLLSSAIAYLYHPKWKALIISLPVPFTMATLAVGQPINAVNVTGAALLIMFFHGVRILHQNRHWPIVPSIAIMTAAYCVFAMALVRVIPTSEAVFWISLCLLLPLVFWIQSLTPHQDEPGYRTPLPLWIKLPIITVVILIILILKKQLQGFMTVFPMVSVIAVYEARHSLRTMCRQLPILMISCTTMFVIIRLAEPLMGLRWAMLPCWIACLLLLTLFTRRQWARDYAD
ncbi:MAG: hypothetical protein PHW60_04490 [Kiritimatiellae bacterium]|nr:hypothetical protein [Kiritimatiellia bacterium]